jgi:hypothetical protein
MALDSTRGLGRKREPWATGNLALLATLGIVTFALVRVFRVSHNDITTALAVFSAAGGPSAVLGVVLSEIQRIVEIGLILAAVLYLDAEYPTRGRNEREVHVLGALLIFFWIMVIAIGHFIVAIASLVFGLPFVIGRVRAIFRIRRAAETPRKLLVFDRMFRHMPPLPPDAPSSLRSWVEQGRERAERRRAQLRREMEIFGRLSEEVRDALADRDIARAKESLPDDVTVSDEELLDLIERVPPKQNVTAGSRKLRIVGLVLVALFTSSVAYADDPWGPEERIVLEETEPRSGFVLDDAVDTLTVLWDSPREVDYLPQEAVLERGICADPHALPFRTLPELLFGRPNRPNYPPCPED